MKNHPFSIFAFFVGVSWSYFVSVAAGSEGVNIFYYGPFCFLTGALYYLFFVFLGKAYDNSVSEGRFNAIKYFIFALLFIFLASWTQIFILDSSFPVLSGHSYGWLQYALQLMLFIQVLVSLIVIPVFFILRQKLILYTKTKFILFSLLIFFVGFMALPFVVQYKVGAIRDAENSWYYNSISLPLPTSIEECNKFLTEVRDSCIKKCKSCQAN